MSWLKDIGIALRDGLEIGSYLMPGLAPIFGLGERLIDSKLGSSTTVTSVATAAVPFIDTAVSIAQDVIKAEVMIQGEKMGASRQVAVAPLALQTLLASPLAAGKKLVDPVAAKIAAGSVAGGLAQFLNAFESIEENATKQEGT